ncbi:hypothetical protein H2198_001647 [Neophaeococcomyces mojaviensis]|uniref:Uncharacterized protein n=1 Tax=Neophaeococcomyces mojaviensis TaxID=3383035 RepID=A0ACC3AGV5_9EURO|nr:hypothetical protein H2198_001647 [Knufia sp. JES_112]
MAHKLPPIALFGYDSSPFTQKIRLALRFLQLPYTFIIVPSMMPRPILVDNFNLTYRKIPVLAIGRDVFIDTSLILEHLHSHPALRWYRQAQGAGAEIHHDTRGRVLARLLSSHYTDRPLFRLTTGLIPSVVWRTKFGDDRARLIGHVLDPSKLEKKVPKNLASLDTYLSILEPLFLEEQGGWFLGTEQPSAADISLWYQLEWGEKISRGEGIENLTGGGTADGMGEGMKEVFNKARYPGLWDWYERFNTYVDGLPNVETRVERGDEVGIEKLMRMLEDVEQERDVPMLPTPAVSLQGLEERIGLRIGTKVSIVPDDTGRGDPTVGKLVAISPEEAVIEPDEPEVVGKKGRRARIERVRLHFPKVGFVIQPMKEAKL